MSSRQLKSGCFVLEGLNSFATVYYAYYLYFFMQKEFGFDNKANLELAALNGLITMFVSWWGGKFAQRFGYFTALKLGFAIMAGALAVGSQVNSAIGQVLVMAGLVTGMCFTWPTLEALVSEGESPESLPRMIGLYNVVWAGMGALAYFTGGAILDKLGLKSLFYIPAAIFLSQLAFTFWLEAQARLAAARDRISALSPRGTSGERVGESGFPSSSVQSPEPKPSPIAKAKIFLRMAWLANPFAYIAI